MAQFVNTEITIKGTQLKQFSSLMLSQGIFEHHIFRLVCPAEAIDGSSGAIFDKSKGLAGAAITIRVSAIGGQGVLQFAGVITEVEAARFSGHAGNIVINGFSPTILMDDGPQCRTWEKKTIKSIVQEVLSPFPQNLLQSKIDSTNSDTQSYTVQYKETAWQFLKRLSADYGEWLLFDGEKLSLGLPNGTKTDLVYGTNLTNFNMSMRVKPAMFEMMAYDYMNNEVYTGSPNGVSGKAGLSELGKHALQASQAFYRTKPKDWHNDFVTNKKQLNDYIDTRAAMQSSSMIRFTGNSGHPGVQVGGTVSIKGKNVFNKTDETFGDYTVISVHHHCDGQGNYTNDFVAVPSSIKVPPVNFFREPHCETQSAIVTDNNDKKGLGRVRVKFHWMDGSEKTPWLRVVTPHAGTNKGIFFMPEVNEEVMIGFEGDSATKPYVIGTVYNSKRKCEFSNDGNDLKVIKTRSNNKIEFNDKNGSVKISDSHGNQILLNGNGAIEIKSSKKITVKSKDISISADDSISLNASNININASQELKMEGKGIGASIKGQKVEIEATTNASLHGMDTEIKGDIKLELEGAAMASLTGALVKIN